MKRYGAALFLLFFAVAASQAQVESSNWTIVSYTDAYVAASTEMQDQLDKIGTLESTLETSRIRKDSAISIEQKELELSVARLAVREIENSVASEAVSLYVAYVSATRDLASSRDSFDIAQAEYEIVQNRFQASEDSELDLLNQQVSLLQARKSLDTATKKANDARNALVRPLEIGPSAVFSVELPILDPSAGDIVFDIAAIEAASSKYYQTYHTVRLKEKELTAKSRSPVFTSLEISTLRDELDQAKEDLQSQIWNLEDEKASIELSVASARADFEIAQLNLRISQTNLDTSELQFQFGELLRTDLDSARSKVRSSHSSIESLSETLLKTLLSAEDLSGGSVRERLKQLVSADD